MALSCNWDISYSLIIKHRTESLVDMYGKIMFILKDSNNLENVAAHGIGSFIDHEILCKHNFVLLILQPW